MNTKNRIMSINPLESNVTFLYPLKTSENLWFSDVFRGYRNVTLDSNGLKRSGIPSNLSSKGLKTQRQISDFLVFGASLW